MNNNAAWIVTLIIILPTLCLKGEQDISTNGKNIVKNVLTLKNRRSTDAWSTLDLSTRWLISMGVQTSLKTKVPWKNKYLNITAPQIIKAVELREVSSERSTHLPPLSVKDTLLNVYSDKAPTSRDLSLSASKDYTQKNFASGGKIMQMPRKLGNRGKHRWVHEKLGHYILWKSPRERESQDKLFFQSYYRHSFLNRLESVTSDKFSSLNDTESIINYITAPSKQISKRHIRALEGGFFRHVLKREVPVQTEDHDDLDFSSDRKKIIVISEENVTAINEIYQTTGGSHPGTVKPEGEEIVPGMTKSFFITVTSLSLIVTLCIAVVSLYYIRRRRIRMAMDPERQRLIPFRIYTGIYYNQTGPCF